MDNTKCVICYDSKAEYFCTDCRQSSGLCHACHHTIGYRKYVRNEEVAHAFYAEPINCVICKKNMDYAATVKAFNLDIDELENLDVPEKLAELVSKNSNIL